MCPAVTLRLPVRGEVLGPRGGAGAPRVSGQRLLPIALQVS